MPGSIWFESALRDVERRKLLYEGAILVYGPRPSTQALCDFAYELASEAFHPLDPEKAHYDMPVEQYAALLTDLKPRFIHHPESKRLVGAVLDELGCDPEQTYFDVPRLRTSTSDDYLTSGIAYAFHPHRDTWYSAPACQINWWLPIRGLTPDNGLAFHTRYWQEAIKNSSSTYNYYRWNAEGRRLAAQQIKEDSRIQPKPEEPIELGSQIRPIVPPGGLLLFSGAQLHSSVPNTSGRTRLSIDFRTVNLDDVAQHRGAPNIDWACTGTTMRDYLRRSDLARIPEELVALYDEVPPDQFAETIYRPGATPSDAKPRG